MIFFDIHSIVSYFVVKYHKTRYDTHKLHRGKDERHESWERQRAGVAFALLVLSTSGTERRMLSWHTYLGREIFIKLQIHGAQVPGPEKLGHSSQMEKSSVLAALKKLRLQEGEPQLRWFLILQSLSLSEVALSSKRLLCRFQIRAFAAAGPVYMVYNVTRG